MKENINTTSFGVEVKKKLIELDMTQRELSRQIGINENYLTDILRGRRAGTKYREKIIKKLKLNNLDM
ncbi:hypothetical protein Z957_05300 [Clostridium sp. K25]|uniref:helix-turn-helix domain-containing protein n=1 Tax=Clostridium sp. K25 TaxID=1443109 RepID=UPI0004DA2764|nr:helix-turn-helix transcriptional regulator [Clostridium sp. K25]KEI09316.1 hypothetical protein Z957_05300 [Clostridium sp. K25]